MSCTRDAFRPATRQHRRSPDLRQPGKDRLTYRVQLDYQQAGEPFRPVVFIDAADSAVVWSYENLQAARNRVVYNLNHSTVLPGQFVRSEGGAASLDADVEAAYDRMGSTYDCYLTLFGRDSYDNAGASTVKVRFRCDASDNSDAIFLDDVTLSAH